MRALAALALMLLMSACTPLVGAEAVSVVGTQKTLSDHVISYASGKDCSTLRIQQGQTYCVEDEAQMISEVFCYRTLGGVTCYDQPQQGREALGQNDHNQVIRRDGRMVR